jgi:DNA-binding NarL/FixJ family response regulator
MVGRDAEIDALRRFVDGAGARPCGLFLLGPAGIGKTRLWEEGVAIARAQGVRTLTSRATSSDAQFALAGIGDLLRESAPAVLEQLPVPQRRALAVALLLEEPGPRPLDHAAVAASFLAALGLLSRAQPLLVAVDDAQWLDPASRAVLAFALRRLETERVGLLASVRTERGLELDDLLRALPDDRVVLRDVAPLTLAALYELVRDRFELTLARPMLVRLHETSQGNPFYALEIARLLKAGSEFRADGQLPVPAELADLLARRLAALSPPTRDVLLAAAALARPTRDVLARAFERVDEAVDESIGADILESGHREAILFAHPLLASVHYGNASAAARRVIHGRLAWAAEDIEERALHAALAATGPDADVARTLDEAATRAMLRGAIAAAAALSEEALRLTPVNRPEEARPRLLLAAERHYAAGDTAHAVALLEEALATVQPGAARAQLLWSLGKIKFEGEDTRVGRDLFFRALDEVDDDDGLRARILTSLTFVGGGNVGTPGPLACAREAVEIAARLGDKATLARALAQLASTEFNSGNGLAVDLFERAVALEDELGGLDLDYGPTVTYARALIDAGKAEAARPMLVRLCERGRKDGDAAVNMPLVLLSNIEFQSGDWTRAEELAREAYEIAVQSGREAAEPKGLFSLAWVEASQGKVEEARAHAERALVMTDGRGWSSGGPRGALAEIEAVAENHEGVVDLLMPVVEKYQSRGSLMIGHEFTAAEALAHLGRCEKALALIEPSERAAREAGAAWAIAAAARVHAAVAASAGDLEASRLALEEAVRECARAGNPFELGRALLSMGSVERRLQRKRAARQTIDRALELFENLGATLWADRARNEIARIGGRAAAAGNELTEMERKIAELVSGGRSNKDVAVTLRISTKTVEWNLSKIYRKLGVHSRGELAARSRS